MRRHAGVFGAVVLAVALMATGAHAQLALLTCPTGTSVGKFTPGVTNTPRQVQSEGQALFGPCVDALGAPADLVYASFRYSGQGQVSCLGNNSRGSFSVTWNDGTTSTVANASIITVRPNVVVSVISGTVTQGNRFLGKTLVHTVTLAQTDLTRCSSAAGLGFAAGPGTLTVLGL
jgi:hypothetical protein